MLSLAFYLLCTFTSSYFFLKKRKTDMQCISSVGQSLSTSCYTWCFLLEVFPRLLYQCFPLNCPLEQPSATTGSRMHRGSFMLESFHLQVRCPCVKHSPCPCNEARSYLFLTTVPRPLELYRSAGCFRALWVGCLGWDAGPGMRIQGTFLPGLWPPLRTLSLSCHVGK